MGLSCSKPKPNEVVDTAVTETPPQTTKPSKVDEKIIVEKADHKFLSHGFGTDGKEEWNLEFLSSALNIPIKKRQELSDRINSSTLVKLPPCLNPDGSVYFGQWKRNLYEGTGQLFMKSGTQYIGTFFQGKFNGPGELLFRNKDTYKGLFSGGQRQGKGVLKFANGDVYEGMWHNGARNGFGVERLADGSVYMGNFRRNKRSGIGELKTADGTYYQGNFNNNAITGIGSMSWPDGQSYTGGFRNGLKNGYGTTMWRNGEVLSHKGLYREGKMCGSFRTVKRDGTVEEALYEDDKFVRLLTDEERQEMSQRINRAAPAKTSRTSSIGSEKEHKAGLNGAATRTESLETKVDGETDAESARSSLETLADGATDSAGAENGTNASGAESADKAASDAPSSPPSGERPAQAARQGPNGVNQVAKRLNYRLLRDFQAKFQQEFPKNNGRQKPLTNGYRQRNGQPNGNNGAATAGTAGPNDDHTDARPYEAKPAARNSARNPGSRARLQQRPVGPRRGTAQPTA